MRRSCRQARLALPRLWAAALCVCATAQAAVPDLEIGAGVQYRSPQEVRGFVLGELALLPYAGLRAEAALGQSRGALSGLLWAGPTLSLDFATWVPVLFAGFGYHLGPSALAATVRAELRRYVTMHGAVSFGAGAEWTQREPVQFAGALGYHYQF